MRAVAGLFGPWALLLAYPAGAQAQNADVIVGNWRISQVVPQVCQAITRLDQHIFINITTDKVSSYATLFLENDQWPREASGLYRGSISWDDWLTSQEVDFTLAGGLQYGAVASRMGPSFNDELRTKHRFWLRIADLSFEREIAPNDLGLAFAALDECLKNP